MVFCCAPTEFLMAIVFCTVLSLCTLCHCAHCAYMAFALCWQCVEDIHLHYLKHTSPSVVRLLWCYMVLTLLLWGPYGDPTALLLERWELAFVFCMLKVWHYMSSHCINRWCLKVSMAMSAIVLCLPLRSAFRHSLVWQGFYLQVSLLVSLFVGRLVAKNLMPAWFKTNVF